ncbi:hypothetical protein HDK77DRAFT_455920 [Phyllosticta capitalensis]
MRMDNRRLRLRLRLRQRHSKRRISPSRSLWAMSRCGCAKRGKTSSRSRMRRRRPHPRSHRLPEPPNAPASKWQAAVLEHAPAPAAARRTWRISALARRGRWGGCCESWDGSTYNWSKEDTRDGCAKRLENYSMGLSVDAKRQSTSLLEARRHERQRDVCLGLPSPSVRGREDAGEDERPLYYAWRSSPGLIFAHPSAACETPWKKHCVPRMQHMPTRDKLESEFSL